MSANTRDSAPQAVDAAMDANRTPKDDEKDKWTLMFYIAGDAGLSASMISQLKELTDAGFQEDTNVLLYFDPNCNGKGARIYDVNHYRKQRSREKTVIGDKENPFVRNIAEDCTIQSLPQMPAAVSLRYFLTYSRSYYPANNYILFLMGHGVIVGNDQFLPDDDDGSSVTLAQLGAILKEFGERVRETKEDEFHLVAFHSCGMSSVELAFELQGSARYMMGTQGSAFPGSWPYRQLLKKTFNCMMDNHRGDQLVREILKGLQNLSFYNAHDFWHAGFSADLSICNLKEDNLKRLKSALQALVVELKKGLKNGAREPILLAHWKSQSYFGENYTDLYDLCVCLQKYCPEGGPQNAIFVACNEVKAVLESERSGDDPQGLFDQLVVFSDYFGPAYQHSNGLSIFFPWRAPIDKVITSYEDYEFTRVFESDSWLSFLNDYFFLTKRPMKGSEIKKEPPSKSTIQSRLPFRLEKISDDRLLRLGPPPRQKKAAMAKRIATLEKDMGSLEKEMGTLEKEMGSLAKANQEAGTLGEEMATLVKEMGSLAKEMGTLSKEMGSLGASGKQGEELAKEMGSLEKEMGTLEKEMGSLSKEMGSLAEAHQETGTLEKEMGSLSKEMGTLEKEMGSLSKEMGTLASIGKQPGTLEKEMGSLAKEMATLGLSGMTVIKNFDAPEDKKISSRPRGRPNQGRDEPTTRP